MKTETETAPAADVSDATAASPDTGASPENGGISTDSLINDLRGEFSGALPGANSDEPSGNEPSPGDDPLSTTSDEDAKTSKAGAEPKALDESEADDTAAIEEKVWPPKAIDTVTKLRGQKREIKEQVETLQGQLSEKDTELATLKEQIEEASQKPAKEAEPKGALPFIETTEDLGAYQETLMDRKRELGVWLDGDLYGEPSAEFKDYCKQFGAWDNQLDEPDRTSVKRLRDTVDEHLIKLVPAHAAFLKDSGESSAKYATDEKAMNAAVEARLPWLNDDKSPEYAIYAKALKDVPQIKSHPGWKAFLGV